jgi:hypothetical protein
LLYFVVFFWGGGGFGGVVECVGCVSYSQLSVTDILSYQEFSFYSSDEAGTNAHTVPDLSTIFEAMEPYKSSTGSGSSGRVTYHTAESFQENCTGGKMKRNENVLKSNRNSGYDRDNTQAWEGCYNVQEGCRQSEHYSSDHLIDRITAESLHYKMDAVLPPEEPNLSQNVCFVSSVLQEESNSLEKQAEILGCQQVRERNSRSVKNTGLKATSQNEEALLKSVDEMLIHAERDILGHMGKNECDSDVYKASSLRTQEKCLARGFSELQFEQPELIDPFDRTLIQKLLAHVGFSNAQDSDCYVKVGVQMPRFKIGGTVTLGKFMAGFVFRIAYRIVCLHLLLMKECCLSFHMS